MTVITDMSEPVGVIPPARADSFTKAQWFSRRPVKAQSILATALLHFLVFTVASSKKKTSKPQPCLQPLLRKCLAPCVDVHRHK